MRKKALIFDMDNTILHSRIDYVQMKWVTFDFLRKKKYYAPDFDYDARTTSQLVDDVRADGRLKPEDEAQVWDLIEKVEREGMRLAEAEPGAVGVLAALSKDYYINVLTNNARAGSVLALAHSGLAPYIDLVISRNEVEKLKPDAAGARLLLGKYPEIPKESWLYVGDFWADGAAAKGVDIKFVAYRGNRTQMEEMGVPVWQYINDLAELLPILAMGSQ